MTELNRQTFDDAINEASASLIAAEPRLTVSRCGELLSAYPDAVRALRLRARAFDALSNFQRAAADYQRVLDIVPADIESMVSLALCQQDLRKPADALATARQALEHEPLNEDALRIARESGEDISERGRLSMLRQKFAAGAVRKTLLEIRRLADLPPDRPDIQAIQVEMLYRSGAVVAAGEACQRLIDDQPDCLPAHALLVLIWRKAGAEVLAAEHLREVERLDPDFREIGAWLGADAPAAPRDAPAWIELAVASAASADAPAEADPADHAAYVDSLIAPAPLPAVEKLVFQPAVDEEERAEIVATEPLAWERAAAGEPDEDLPDWLRDLQRRPEADVADGEPLDFEPPYSIERALGGDRSAAQDTEPLDVDASPDVVMETSAPDETSPDLPVPVVRGRKGGRKAKAATPEVESAGPQSAETAPEAIAPEPALGSERPAEVAEANPGQAGAQTQADESSVAEVPAHPPVPAEAEALEIPDGLAVRPPAPAAAGVLEPLEWVPAESVPASPARGPDPAPAPRKHSMPAPIARKAPKAQPAASVAEPVEVTAPAASPEPAPESPAAEPEPRKGKKGKGKKGKGKHRKDIVEVDDDGLLELARLAVVEQEFDRAERYFADFITRGRRVDRALADLEEITQTRPQLWRYFELLGKLHTRKGRVAEALTAYQKALERMR